MKHINLPSGGYLLVPVPYGYTYTKAWPSDWYIDFHAKGDKRLSLYLEEPVMGDPLKVADLPDGKFNIVGIASEITEEVAAGIVEWQFDTCRDYRQEEEISSYDFVNPTDSLKSLCILHFPNTPPSQIIILKIIE